MEISIGRAVPCSSGGKVEISSHGGRGRRCSRSSKEAVAVSMEKEIVTFKDGENGGQLSSRRAPCDQRSRGVLLASSIRIALILAARNACSTNENA